jgi:hypothetical protein
MATKSFSDLIADEDTTLTATAVGDYILIYDTSEPLDINKVKVISIADFLKLQTETARQPIVTGQAAGDIFYASAAGVLARLAKGTALQGLRMNAAATALEYANIIGIDDIKMVNVATNQTFTNSYYEDITGATVTLTLTRTCTILILATCMGYVNGTGSGEFRYRVSIDGTEDSGNILGNGYESTQRNQVVPYIHMATGVAAGSRIAKLQCIEAVAGVDNYVTYAKLIAIAIAQ